MIQVRCRGTDCCQGSWAEAMGRWLIMLAMTTSLVAASCSSSVEPEAAIGGLAPASPHTGPVSLRWLAVGDSYSSGEGLTDVEGRCAMSPSAYGPLVSSASARDWSVDHFVFAACTGAVTADWDTQLDDWKGHGLGGGEGPNLITATFGGNDIGFADTLLDCIGFDDGVELLENPSEIDFESATEALFGRGCDISEEEVQSRIDKLRATLESLYESMSDVVGPDGAVFVLGYPAPVADPRQWEGGRCDGISRRDGEMLLRAASRLNEVIRQATEIRANVWFVGVAEDFEGHGRCSGDEWIFGLADSLDTDNKVAGVPLAETARPFHPNEAGHRAIAAALNRAFDTRFGR